MNGIRPEQFARIGEFYLEEAMLDVPLEAKYENKCLGAAAISKRAGIYRGISLNDGIVTGMLNKLAGQCRGERCEQSNKRGGWKMADKEFAVRRDDVIE